MTGAVGWRREGLVYKKNEVLFFSPFFLLLVPKLVAVHTKALQVRDMFFGHRCFWILWKVLIFLCLLKVYSISHAPRDILV